MKKTKNFINSWFLSISLLLVAIGCQVGNNKAIKEDYTQAKGASSTIIAQAKEEIKTPAISVAVGIDNRIVWAQAIGYKDIEQSALADTNTKFRIGSTSKAVTSVGLGKLMEDKKLNLDAPIQAYLPYFDSSKPVITIRQLASHSSGIRNYRNAEFNSNIEYTTIEDALKVFIYDTLLFQPGSKFSYATYNYTVLSAVMEKISGMPFLEYMNQEVFKPLDMHHTSADYKSKPIESRAEFYNYRKEENSFKKPHEVNNSNKWAGGGFISTPTDLVKLGNALLNHTFLKESTTKQIFEPQKLNNGKINDINYALGWKNDSCQSCFGTNNVQQIYHGGSASGGTSLLVLFPAYNMSIAILINRDVNSADLLKYAYAIGKEFLTQRQVNWAKRHNKANVSQTR